MTTPTDTAPPLPLHLRPEIHSRRWFLLGIMCLSLVLVVMSVSGLNTALPTIQRDLDASASELQWIVDAYAIVFAGLLLTAGSIGDRFGRRRALVGGLAIFAAGSLAAGLASDATQVITARAVMGIGAAFIMPATLSIITAIFPPHERTRAIAVWAGFAGAGASIGPIVTGGLLEEFWWGSTLLVNVPVAAGVIVAVRLFAPDSRDDTRTPLDPIGAVLSLVGISALIFAIIEGPAEGWTSTPVVTAFVVAAGSLLTFTRWERRSDHPMLPLDLFRIRRFSLGSGVVTIAFFVMFGFFFLMTQYLQFARDYSPLEAGLATLPLALTFVAFSPRSAALAARYTPSTVMAAGLAIVAGGFALLTTLSTDTPYLVIAIAFMVMGAGMSFATSPATGEIMTAVPLSKAGVGSAVNDTTRELGGALGIAFSGAWRTPPTEPASSSTASRCHRASARRPPTPSAPPTLSPTTCPLAVTSRRPQRRRSAARSPSRTLWRWPSRPRLRSQSSPWAVAAGRPPATKCWPSRPQRTTACSSPPSTCEAEPMVDAAAETAEDPRVERSRRIILEAVLGELADVGYGGLTIEGVAARAGVGKSTIYRHWPGKLELVEDAFRTLKAAVTVPPAPASATRSSA